MFFAKYAFVPQSSTKTAITEKTTETISRREKLLKGLVTFWLKKELIYHAEFYQIVRRFLDKNIKNIGFTIKKILPKYCLICEKNHGDFFNNVCLDCHQIGLQLNKRSLVQARKKSYFLYSLFETKSDFSKILYQAKYKYCVLSASYIQEVAKRFFQHQLETKIDLLLVVPSEASRIRTRKYDFLSYAAQSIVPSNKSLLSRGGLVRIRHTPSQTSKSKKDRLKNIANAFSLNCKVKNKRVCIMDDVYTTGATLSECARIVEKGRPSQITFFTLFKTE